MENPTENMNWWVPAPGDIVRLKKGLSQTLEGLSLHAAGIDSQKEGQLYEVREYIQNNKQRVLSLRKVRVIHAAGKEYATPGEEIPFTHAIGFFEPVRKYPKNKQSGAASRD